MCWQPHVFLHHYGNIVASLWHRNLRHFPRWISFCHFEQYFRHAQSLNDVITCCSRRGPPSSSSILTLMEQLCHSQMCVILLVIHHMPFQENLLYLMLIFWAKHKIWYSILFSLWSIWTEHHIASWKEKQRSVKKRDTVQHKEHSIFITTMTHAHFRNTHVCYCLRGNK